VRVVLQGAVGDQSVRGATGDGDAALDGYAAGVVATDDALPALPPIDGTALSTATASVALPEPAPRAVPGWLRRAASTVAWSLLPANARVTAVRIGPALLLAVPAEPTAEVAAEWRRAAGDGAEVVSLVGGYAGYVETPERTVTGAGEAVRSYYGPELAPRLEAAIAAAARATLP
jgi:neutral ceramidase